MRRLKIASLAILSSFLLSALAPGTPTAQAAPIATVGDPVVTQACVPCAVVGAAVAACVRYPAVCQRAMNYLNTPQSGKPGYVTGARTIYNNSRPKATGSTTRYPGPGPAPRPTPRR
jgi:hypothetical protein